jgi:membrane protease YdiL (CAAX protease family)
MSHRGRILLEVVAFVVLALASRAALMLVAWRFAGPLSLAIVLGALTLYMHWRGLGWRDFGLQPLPGTRAKLRILPQALLVFAAFCAAVGTVMLISKAFGLAFMNEIPKGVADRWGDIHGNWPLFIVWLVIAVLSGGFAEEMFFRGYLVTRLRAFLGEGWIGSVVAVILPAMFFGYGHMYYQGVRGLISTSAIGIAFGTMFLLLRRNLWPVILVHAVVDSIAFTATFLGAK